MSGNFFDTNCVVYMFSNDEQEKETGIIRLIESQTERGIISTQVLNEFSNVFLRKFQWDNRRVKQVISYLSQLFYIATVTLSTVKLALEIKDSYRFQYFDCLMLASAMECQAEKIYSEDMQHGQIIQNSLQIINPFEE